MPREITQDRPHTNSSSSIEFSLDSETYYIRPRHFSFSVEDISRQQILMYPFSFKLEKTRFPWNRIESR